MMPAIETRVEPLPYTPSGPLLVGLWVRLSCLPVWVLVETRVART